VLLWKDRATEQEVMHEWDQMQGGGYTKIEVTEGEAQVRVLSVHAQLFVGVDDELLREPHSRKAMTFASALIHV